FEFVNATYLLLAGRRHPGDLVGKPLRQALPELEGQGYYELADRVFATGEPFVADAMPAGVDRRGDGTLDEGFFSMVVQPYRGASGAIEGLLVHAVEVTEQVRARQRAEALAADLAAERNRLQASEERYRSLVAATTAVVWTTNAAGAFVEPQPSWEAYTGQSWETHGGWEWAQMYHPDDRERIKRQWARALAEPAVYASEGRVWHAADR